jgi:hypothetical protein
MERSVRSAAERARWAIPLIALALGCGGEERTSVLLTVALAPGTVEVPEELRVFARHGGTSVFEDQRLPKAGKLVPRAVPELGTILLELGDDAGDLDIDVYGVRGGERRLYGHTHVVANAGRQTAARIELWPMAPAKPPMSGGACKADTDCARETYCLDGTCGTAKPGGEVCAPDSLDPTGNHQCASNLCADGHCCSTACGLCQACTGAGGACEPLPVGREDVRAGMECRGAQSCDGRGGCRKNNGQPCVDTAECASGFCVDGTCCNTDCSGACRRCGTGTCTTITNAVDPRTCTNERICDAAGECLKVNGRFCTSARECASGFCVDGSCCNGGCDAPCQSCRTGTCTVLTNARDRECTGTKSCDARGVCR